MNFLNNKYARIVTVILILQAIVFYTVALRAENPPADGSADKLAGRHRRLADVPGRQD